jgi:hypothetical protein
VIGNPQRYDECHQTTRTIDLDAPEGTYTIGPDGTAQVVLKYDPFFVGKDAYLYANLYVVDDHGNHKRVGVGMRQKLRGGGFEAATQSFDCPAGESCTRQFSFYTPGGGINHPLINVEPAFIKDQGPGCSIYFPRNLTGCDGSLTVVMSNYPPLDENNETVPSKCTVTWTGALKYEY